MQTVSYLTSAQLAVIIRKKRRADDITAQQMGEAMDRSRQWIHRAENPDKDGPQLNELRVRIFQKLFPGEVLTGPFYVRSTPAEASLLDQVGERSRAA